MRQSQPAAKPTAFEGNLDPLGRRIEQGRGKREESDLALQLPPADRLKTAFEKYGISNDTRIILYWSSGWYSPTTRVYFTLDYVGLAANTSLTVGEATIEGDVTDSVTTTRLAAFVDERIGQRSLRGLGTWSQVDAAFEHWGEQLANRLVALREGKPVE